MSGPKIDYAELERIRQAELERQRQERLRRIQEETDKLNKEIGKAKKYIEDINRHLIQVIAEVQNKEEMKVAVSDLKELKSSCISMINKNLAIAVPIEPSDISAYSSRLAKEAQAIAAHYENAKKPYEERITEYSKQLKIMDNINSLSGGFSARVQKLKDISGSIDFEFNLENDNEIKTEQKIEQTTAEKATQIFEEIEKMVNLESIQDVEMELLFTVANKIHKAAFETKTSFDAAAIEFSIAKTKITKNMVVFDSLYQDYYAQYIAYMELLKKSGNVGTDIKPEEKYLFSSISDLDNEIKIIEKEAKELHEKNYIREQINEVMTLLGYNMAEEIVIDINQKGNNYIYKDNSAQSAIHVHVSDKKQIMMEVVGVGESTAKTDNDVVDAIVTHSAELSDLEREKCFHEQRRFCDIHPKIVEELKKRGVVLDKKVRKAPDLKYSKKITPLTIGDDTAPVISEIGEHKKIEERAKERRRKDNKKAKLHAIKI